MDEDKRDWVESYVKPFGFKLAKLYMLKEGLHESKKDTFMTAHSLDEDEIFDNMRMAMEALQRIGVKVLRYKIEDVIIDSRKSDILKMIGNL
jgi:hypothetical protein